MGDANDPEVYISAVVAVLAKYPVEIMSAVCDPSTGLPSTLKWLPTVAEVVAECARLDSYRARSEAREKRITEQIAERKALPAPKPRRDEPRGRIVTWGEVEQMGAVHVHGVFDKDRKIPYRG